MAFPDGWPPRRSPGALNIAFFKVGTADTLYENNAYLFIDGGDAGASANPFRPTSYVEHGQEQLNVSVPDLGPGTPMGTGQDPRDARPFNPDLFFRGNGTASPDTSFTSLGNVVTYVDRTKKFNQGFLNKEIVIRGATSSGNDGVFIISEYVNQHTLRWENATGVAEDFPTTGDFRIRTEDDGVIKAAVWSSTIRIRNRGGVDIFFSLNGTDDHGRVPSGEAVVYRNRAEAGIALRVNSGTCDFDIEAW